MAEALTRGRRCLLAVLQQTTEREVAARCGVTHQAVSLWLQGVQKPAAARRLKLQELYGIEPPAWDAAQAHLPG
jgi:transcriptional regulator with XRE-family HTH domain